jgi:[ribosomal protein S18]-alanine N-acetyltransferase
MIVTIREMEKSDVERVTDLEKECFDDPWSFEQIRSETDGQRYKFPLVLQVNDSIEGYAFVWAYAGEVHITNIAISPAFRQKGLGLKLISFIFETFKEFKEIFLEVRPTNINAIHLYEKVGFEKVFSREKYYADGENALVMRKELQKRG